MKIGIIGRHRLVFVPLQGATVSPKHLRVPVSKGLVKDAPSIDIEGELASTEEPAVFAHYGLAYTPGATGERRLGRRYCSRAAARLRVRFRSAEHAPAGRRWQQVRPG